MTAGCILTVADYNTLVVSSDLVLLLRYDSKRALPNVYFLMQTSVMMRMKVSC